MNKRSSTTALGALLLAAVAWPAFAASPYEPFVSKGVSWLTSNQNIDGSWSGDSTVVPAATAEAWRFLPLNNRRIQFSRNPLARPIPDQ